MLRIISNCKLIKLTFESSPINYQNFQSVRWRRNRKPIWLPTAKSKVFRIPKRPEISVEEDEELKRLHNNYRTAMKSIRNFLINKHTTLFMAESNKEQLQQVFEEDFAKSNEINNKWNEELKILREERVAKELAADIEFAKNRMARLLKEKEEKLAQVEEIVRREKEAVANFITPENLDEAISRAIDNPVDYNFAIDLEGNRIMGRETNPQEVEIKQ